jgi:L-fuconolactonase
MPIVDAHHHLWVRPKNQYLLQEFSDDLNCGHKIVSTVFIECQTMYRATGPEATRPVGETEFVASIAAMSERGHHGPTRVAHAIVGFADLSLGAQVEPVLEEHIIAAAGRFRGIRYATGWDASPDIRNSHAASGPRTLAEPAVRAGLTTLATLELAFDAMVFHTQTDDLIDLAQALPGLSIVVGHAGGPLGYGPYSRRDDEVFGVWKAAMQRLAKHPNVTVKLGGLLIRLAAIDYRTAVTPPSSDVLAARWRRYLETSIEQFGADRCMFESNFPVEKMGTGYATLWNAFKRLVEDASESEKQQLFSGTARRVYRLEN